MENYYSRYDFRYAKNDDIEIRIDLAHPGLMVEYRLAPDGEEAEWHSTPFQSYEFNSEDAALKTIDGWLE